MDQSGFVQMEAFQISKGDGFGRIDSGVECAFSEYAPVTRALFGLTWRDPLRARFCKIVRATAELGRFVANVGSMEHGITQ